MAAYAEVITPHGQSHEDPDGTPEAAGGGDTDGAPTEDPRTFDRRRRESALGAVATGVARGLHAVFARPVDEPVIVASVPGDPPDTDDRLRVILDPDDPTKAVAIVPDKPDRADKADPPPS